ncbi:hypothetical protein EIP91_003390 [Steccherinum ochraceum]|uniref:Uncharacterized protein n=1 Tax=Steccherinum ochraceum TaxID=92696 RepID=A0A4V6N749_9APHY|nr:hypothetical protein EIP91_003390 [Steccherinum ochraceum]
MDASELCEVVAVAADVLKKMMSDSNEIIFSLGGDQSRNWNSSVQMGWHDVLTAVITDIHKLSGLCSHFEEVLADVLEANSEMTRLDFLWAFITTLNSTCLTYRAAFQTFVVAVQATVTSYDTSLANDPTEAAALRLVDTYPATVLAARVSLDFLTEIWGKLECDVAELMLWARRRCIKDDQNLPSILQSHRKLGLSIYFCNARMLDSFSETLIASE